ncbi:four-carbon acid sugar kinase family protein [Microbacterium sp. Ru50]|uniref:four-carbon acid sugar kinase family protein n=1 Tax=Microbacterium sp. Ru50 TaxID=2080744 RepID=UPI002156188E|nr:four-carbon acid sugar kinase family protein [Microbacterium sp. Ru50]
MSDTLPPPAPAPIAAAFYGDDFTGSVDALLQYARNGRTGRLFVGTPPLADLADAAAASEVVGIAGIARSLPPDELETELRPALTRLASLRPALLQYKACSTADSSPEIGSLGRVIEVGRSIVTGAAGAPLPIPMLFAQPDFGRYTAFGHHFAAERGIVYRLDRQPTMSAHPATPMSESDLALHLGRQTDLPIASLAFPSYTSSRDLAAAIAGSRAAALVLDALDSAHLEVVGAAIAQLAASADGPVFAIGSGGLSWGLSAAGRHAARPIPTTSSETGPVLVVSGSRSPATRRQADAAATAGWLVRPLGLGATDTIDDVLSALASGRSVVLTSDDAVGADASSFGTGTGDALLEAIAAASASVVLRAARSGATRRVVVCGGDTSSRVTGLLGARSLSLAANPWSNIVLLRAHADDPTVDGLELLLKGGQVGDDDLFERVRALAD